MSNMFTDDLPPKTALSVASALICRLFFESCSLFFLMYAQSRLVTSVRGIGLPPTTAARVSLGCTGFMNAAFGFRLLAAFFAMSSPCVGRQSRPPAAAGSSRRHAAWLPHSMNAFPLWYQRKHSRSVVRPFQPFPAVLPVQPFYCPRPDVAAAFFTHSAIVFHSGSFCDCQCFPPGWNSVPPASCASGIISSRLFVGTPGTTKRATISKFFRDSSSLYAVRPAGSGCSRNAVPVEGQTEQRAWPGRFSVKSGWILVLKVS